jgi:hypothetical protein
MSQCRLSPSGEFQAAVEGMRDAPFPKPQVSSKPKENN